MWCQKSIGTKISKFLNQCHRCLRRMKLQRILLKTFLNSSMKIVFYLKEFQAKRSYISVHGFEYKRLQLTETVVDSFSPPSLDQRLFYLTTEISHKIIP